MVRLIVNLPKADTGVASPLSQVGPLQALPSNDLYMSTLLWSYHILTSRNLQTDDSEMDYEIARHLTVLRCSLCVSGRPGPQYAFQPVMHAATYASALKGVSQSCCPHQLSAAAPEFVPHSARALQDFHPLISSRWCSLPTSSTPFYKGCRFVKPGWLS